MSDRIKLAEAMGWRVEEKDRVYDHYSPMKCGRYGHLPHMSVGQIIPDPFTDANDDYAVLEWLRERGLQDDSNLAMDEAWFAILEKGEYKIGDYARAALKVIE